MLPLWKAGHLLHRVPPKGCPLSLRLPSGDASDERVYTPCAGGTQAPERAVTAPVQAAASASSLFRGPHGRRRSGRTRRTTDVAGSCRAHLPVLASRRLESQFVASRCACVVAVRVRRRGARASSRCACCVTRWRAASRCGVLRHGAACCVAVRRRGVRAESQGGVLRHGAA